MINEKKGGGVLEQNEGPNTVLGKTESGLDANLAGLLCYVLGFITGIVFLVIEKKNRFVRFHAMQSTIVFIALAIVNFVLGWIPFLGFIVSFILVPITLILWIILMYNAYQGNWFKLPIAGDMAEKQLG